MNEYISDLFEVEGKVIGITSGCFDMLHPLHILYLNKCRRECDILIVLIDSDQFIKKNKKYELYFNEEDRKYMVGNLRCVDGVDIVNNLDHLINTVNGIVQTYSESGADSFKVFKNCNEIYGQPVIQFIGTELVIIEDVERFSSTTQIKEFIIKQQNKTK